LSAKDCADGEHVGFDSASAVHAPVVFGHGLGELELQGAFGGQAFHYAFAKDVMGVAIFFWHEIDLTRHPVSQRVHFRFLPGFWLRAGGFCRVRAVGGDLLF
jgi:hypothetical protein